MVPTKNINLVIMHVITFLSSTPQTLREIYKMIEDTDKEIAHLDPEKDGVPAKIRKLSVDCREDCDDELDILIDEWELFKEEMKFIKENKASEEVIYSINKFKKYKLQYKDLYKDMRNLYDRIVKTNSEYRRLRRYVLYIASSKYVSPAHKIYTISEDIYDELESFLK